MSIRISLAAISAALLLSACGGGGGGGGNAPAPNNPPTANAGPDQSAVENGDVQLAGSGSDSDGGTLSYSWSQTAGPAGTFSSTTAADAMFTVPLVPVGEEASIVLRLTVSDGQGGSSSDEMTITATSADYIVFVADKETDGVNELFQYDTQTASLIKLNGPLVAGGRVLNFRISPDGESVAYVANQDNAGNFELYVAAADGSGVVKVGAPMANPAGNTADFRWSPDGQQLVYTADADIDGVTEIYLVDRDGANHQKINGSVAGGIVLVTQPTWSPDGRYIAQIVIDTSNNRRVGINVYDTTVGAPNSVRVSDLAGFGEIGAIGWAPDSSALAYLADQDTENVDELYSALPDGSAITKLNPTLAVGASIRTFRWAPDASRIAYQANQNNASVNELFTSLPDGGGNVRINPTEPLTGNVGQYTWAPDASRVAYVAALDATNALELYASDPNGTNNIKLNGALVSGGDVIDFLWSPDGSRVAYFAEQETAGVREIFVSNADGTMNAKFNQPIITGGQLFFTSVDIFNMWSPDSTRFVYPAVAFAIGDIEHFVTEDGTNHAQATRTAVGTLTTFAKWSADSSHVLYLSDQDTAGTEELYIGSADGLTNTKISGMMVANGNATFSFEWSP